MPNEISVEKLKLLAGSLPRKQLKIVTGWLAFHEEEAYKAWNLVVRGEHFEKLNQ